MMTFARSSTAPRVASMIAAAASFALLGAASAQERPDADEEIAYEFSFAYEAGETERERMDRLDQEVAVYCDGIEAQYYCEEEISGAVTEAMEDDRDRYAAR